MKGKIPSNFHLLITSNELRRGRKYSDIFPGKEFNWIGKKHKVETKEKISNALKGINNPRWKGGITGINQKIRDSKRYKEWRREVFIRDNFTCVMCGNKEGGNLQADHIKKFSDYPKHRFRLSNGRTLCKKCHKIVHSRKKFMTVN